MISPPTSACRSRTSVRLCSRSNTAVFSASVHVCVLLVVLESNTSLRSRWVLMYGTVRAVRSLIHSSCCFRRNKTALSTCGSILPLNRRRLVMYTVVIAVLSPATSTAKRVRRCLATYRRPTMKSRHRQLKYAVDVDRNTFFSCCRHISCGPPGPSPWSTASGSLSRVQSSL